MSKILVVGNYAPTDVAAFRDEFGVTPLASLAQLAEAARDDCVALAFKGGEPLGGAAMDLLPNLRLIANFGVGYDAISIADADARGIKVTNTPDVLNDDVADLAVAMLISRQREMAPAERWLRDGNWPAEGAYPLARKMSGRKVGILGMGRIGREIADRLAAFKCQIHYQSRSRKDTPAGWTYHADPVALAAAVDDLVVSVVGGAETQGFVSDKVIAALGADGVIVNISRGSVIDEEALIRALQNGQIRGAALDVFRNEPKVDPRFLTLPNVLLLPHIGSATVETRARMGALQRQNLTALLAGQPLLTPVN